jgi:hypothetical protein
VTTIQEDETEMPAAQVDANDRRVAAEPESGKDVKDQKTHPKIRRLKRVKPSGLKLLREPLFWRNHATGLASVAPRAVLVNTGLVKRGWWMLL